MMVAGRFVPVGHFECILDTQSVPGSFTLEFRELSVTSPSLPDLERHTLALWDRPEIYRDSVKGLDVFPLL